MSAMSSRDAALPSNNPFRSQSSGAEPEKPKKIVKRVRVQSPPPPSPEDAASVTRFPALDDINDYSSDSDRPDDPFDNHATHDLPSHIPPNPFAPTLHDIERSPAHRPGPDAPPPKGSLDVSAFKQLLLTGRADNTPSPAPVTSFPRAAGAAATATAIVPRDGVSNADTTSTVDDTSETERTSQENSEPHDVGNRKRNLPTSRFAPAPRTKPPPPNSRHGKLIKIELGADGQQPPSGPSSDLASSVPATATDVNKPLPAPPLRAIADEDSDSPFDREAAGKVPEAFAQLQASPKPPSPPTSAARERAGSQGSTHSGRPAAPPPRRHRRGDSRAQPAHPPNAEEEPPRSSMESGRSRTDSLRAVPDRSSHAPAPPPPRRPAPQRDSGSYMSLSRGSPSPVTSPGFDERAPSGTPITSPVTSPGLVTEDGRDAKLKLSPPLPPPPPPPPPARKPSTRRTASVRSVDSNNSTRKVSKEQDGTAVVPPPPPPPPRARGSGRPTLGSAVSQPASGDKDGTTDRSVAASDVDQGGKQGKEILADLDALQREVDALMKKTTTTTGT